MATITFFGALAIGLLVMIFIGYWLAIPFILVKTLNEVKDIKKLISTSEKPILSHGHKRVNEVTGRPDSPCGDE